MHNIDFVIRPIKREEWEMAMQLCWDTFLVYEAPEYDREGTKNFHDFVKGDQLKTMFIMGEYDVYGAFSDNVIVGVLGVRNNNHISLLFVEPQYHHQGIASSLLKQAFRLTRDKGFTEMTVNSSPYAVQFYHKLGFSNLSGEKKADGITFTPMIVKI